MTKKDYYRKLLEDSRDDLAAGKIIKVDGTMRQYDKNLLRQIAADVLGFPLQIIGQTIGKRRVWTPPAAQIVDHPVDIVQDDGDTGL